MPPTPTRILLLKPGRPSGRQQARGRTALVLMFVGAVATVLAADAPPANFIVHGAVADRGSRIARHAEDSRERIFAVLLGVTPPKTWTVRCEIHLHGSEQSFAEAVGGPPDGARGATSIEFAGADAVLRRIDLMDDDPDGIPAALDHELVHMVLADRFTAGPPPRWADEGLAVLFDEHHTQAAHDDDFRTAHRTDMTWGVADLLEMEEYPREGHRQRVFYGQSASLVRWLLARSGPGTLLAFLDDATSIGHPAALEQHYGFDSPAALERAWLADVERTTSGGN